jgi:polar amino acid transport system permease protein
VERVYPALTGQFVLLMLSSSVASQISAEELTAIANRVQSDTFRSLETYLTIAALYIALAMLMKLAFWILGQVVFTRRRVVGTPH